MLHVRCLPEGRGKCSLSVAQRMWTKLKRGFPQGSHSTHDIFDLLQKVGKHSMWNTTLTLPMLRLLSSKEQGCKDFWKLSKPCHVVIHYIALTEYSQMSTHMPGFRSFVIFLRHFELAKLATSSIRMNPSNLVQSTMLRLLSSKEQGCKCF